MTSFDSGAQYMHSTTSAKGVGAWEGIQNPNSVEFDRSPPFSGIYLRPNLFMINGTASGLMDVLYPPKAPLPFFQHSEPSLMWWGYQSSAAPARWVSFEYTLYEASCMGDDYFTDFPHDATSRLRAMSSQDFTTEEVIAPRTPGTIGEKVEQNLMQSLRENRLLALTGVKAHCCQMGRYLERGQRVNVVLGCRAGMNLQESVLHTNIEVALRAMNVEDETMFVSLFSYNSQYAFAVPELRFIRIKLLERYLQEPLLAPRLMQKFVVRLPPVQTDENTLNHVYRMIHPFSFFLKSIIFLSDPPCALVRLLSREVMNFIYSSSRRGLCMSVMMALGNSLVDGLPSPMKVLQNGIPSASLGQLEDALLLPHRLQQHFQWDQSDKTQIYDSNEMPTNLIAQEFLNHRFFAMPRDGARVNCRVAVDNILSDGRGAPREVKDVLIGGTSLPVWMDLALQSMRPHQKDILCAYTGDADIYFFCYFASAVRGEAEKQIQALDRALYKLACKGNVSQETSSSCFPLWQEEENHTDHNTCECGSADTHGSSHPRGPPSAGSSLGSTAATNEFSELSEVEQSMFTPHNFGCSLVLHSFEQAYDTNCFYFVNRLNALRTVQALWKETNALFEEKPSCNTGHALPCLRCAAKQEIELQKTPNGCSAPMLHLCSVVKAIQKMNFAVLLLTFNVSEAALSATPDILQEWCTALSDLFCRLGLLYRLAKLEPLVGCAIEAYSAAIAFNPTSCWPWLGRVMTFTLLRRQEEAIRDLEVAEVLYKNNPLPKNMYSLGKELSDDGLEAVLERVRKEFESPHREV